LQYDGRWDKINSDEGDSMKKSKAFTLLEMMIVVVIVGILATLGAGQYSRVVENSRGLEATEVLLKCYAGYQRIEADDGNLSWGNINGRWDRLGMGDPNTLPAPPRYFSYSFAQSGGHPQVIATRIGNASQKVTINLDDGTMTATFIHIHGNYKAHHGHHAY
jgi:prepilin-type N-terminal cleavage/methylation domain-containing protein